MASSRDIFALPGELSRAILESTGANEGIALLGRKVRRKFGNAYYIGSITSISNHKKWWHVTYDDGDDEDLNCSELHTALLPNPVLNRMALVGRMWHTMLAPSTGACMPALTRCVTLDEPDMLAVAQIARPWWRSVQGRQGAYGHIKITDTGLASLAAGCPAITSLNLEDCIVITDAGLASLAAGCPAITSLNLEDCIEITDTGLASLAAGCPHIFSLNLRFCRQVTDTGLMSLAARCPAITTLDLSLCDQITDAGLASLAAEYPSIDITK